MPHQWWLRHSDNKRRGGGTRIWRFRWLVPGMSGGLLFGEAHNRSPHKLGHGRANRHIRHAGATVAFNKTQLDRQMHCLATVELLRTWVACPGGAAVRRRMTEVHTSSACPYSHRRRARRAAAI
jgi:hypothetical protein